MSSYITAFSGGSIQVIFGPMFSGKTTELMRRVKRFTVAQYNCMVIKYAKDTRYSVDQAATHDRMTCSAISCARLSELDVKLVDEYDVLAVDEGQFFPDVVEFCESMANAGKIVLVAALDGTFERKEFNNILKLVPLAEEVVKLNAVCMVCHKEAAFSKRIGQEKEVEVIGGTDKYIAACRRCYFGKPAMANTPRKRKAATIYNPTAVRMRSASSASSSTLPATPEVEEPTTSSDEEPSSPIVSAAEAEPTDVVVSAQA